MIKGLFTRSCRFSKDDIAPPKMSDKSSPSSLSANKSLAFPAAPWSLYAKMRFNICRETCQQVDSNISGKRSQIMTQV